MGKEDYNIILINLDGLRRDRVELCSTLNNLKEENCFFSNMFTVAPYTFASLHAIFSGMYPSRNGMNAYYNIFKFKKDEITTLPQLLQNEGYYTCCDIINKVVIPNQGFDELNIFDEETVDFKQRHRDLIKKLANKDKFFLFLHFTETHKHLVREIVKKYKQESNDDEFFNLKDENIERYNSYLPSCDSYVSAILDILKESKIEHKTILIFFSDHGTSIGERKGEKFYGVFTYDYTINVFCIIKTPEKLNKKIEGQCQTIDLYPTISDMLGIKLEENSMIQGKSLFKMIENLENDEREVFVETGGLYGPWPSSKKHNVFCLRSKMKKIIYNETPNSWEFYDLKKDPNELQNIYDEENNDVLEYKKKLMKKFEDNNIDLGLKI
ncbi:sulfatase-like hydrolase/transferase [Nitrosopumilus sp.]|uniref:sulfatase family protein n=1 Tax=Nitrosopumilus sp. TaxID=2024843 RepID=UPI002608491A|nr:sulfatase-like hydrolase/transferase [Nitrosopumilus sp.]